MANANPIIFSLYLVVLVNTVLSAIIFSRGRRNRFNILFGFIALSTAAWCVAVSGFYSEYFNTYTNWLTWTHFFALFIGLVFLYFSFLFPTTLIKSKFVYIFASFPFFAISYDIFWNSNIVGKSTGLEYQIGPIYLYYEIVLVAYFLAGYLFLYLQYRKNREAERRQQIKYVLIGSILASTLGMTTDLIFPYLKIFNFTWLGPIFTLILVVSIFIAILRYHLFKIQVIVAELFSLIVLVLLTFDIFLTESLINLSIKAVVLVAVAIFMFFFIRGVYKLENANERLKSLDELKSQFISFATHQIRGPLTAIKGYSSLLLEGDYGDVPKVLLDPLDKIFKSSSSLAVLVEDYLNISRIEQGRMKYDYSIFDLAKLVTEVVDELRTNAQSKNLTIHLHVPSDIFVKADYGKVKQVVANILDNAIKYTPKGSIKVTISHGKDEKSATVSVKDTGAGISEKTISKLFQKFSRSEDAAKYNILGTGLGLYVAKELITAQGGKIWVESEGEGHGSTFFVELPLSDKKFVTGIDGKSILV